MDQHILVTGSAGQIGKAAVKALLRACERNKKAAGFLCGDVKTGKQYLDWGFRALAYGVDSVVYQSTLKAGIDGLRTRG